MLVCVDLSCLLDFAVFTCDQHGTIIGEKDSCIVLINHNSQPPMVLYKYTAFIHPFLTNRKHLRAQNVKKQIGTIIILCI